MSLYQISNDLLSVLNGGLIFDEETGEIIFDEDNLDELKIKYEDKLEGCGLYIKNELAEIEAMKAEEKRLAERRRIKENKVERLKRYMLDSMDKTSTDRLETPRIAISTRKSSKLIVDDISLIPDMFLKTETTITPDKEAIKKAMKDGEVKGAHLEEGVNISIR